MFALAPSRCIIFSRMLNKLYGFTSSRWGRVKVYPIRKKSAEKRLQISSIFFRFFPSGRMLYQRNDKCDTQIYWKLVSRWKIKSKKKNIHHYFVCSSTMPFCLWARLKFQFVHDFSRWMRKKRWERSSSCKRIMKLCKEYFIAKFAIVIRPRRFLLFYLFFHSTLVAHICIWLMCGKFSVVFMLLLSHLNFPCHLPIPYRTRHPLFFCRRTRAHVMQISVVVCGKRREWEKEGRHKKMKKKTF